MTSRKDWKFGVSLGYRVTQKLIEQAAEGGVECVEVACRADNGDFVEIGKWAKDAGIQVWSRHLDFVHYNLTYHDKARVRKTMELHYKWLFELGEIGGKAAVIHAGSDTLQLPREEHMQEAIYNLNVLVDFAKYCGVTLCVENLPRMCLGRNSDEILRFVREVPGLKVCYDTNHLPEEKPVEFVPKVGQHIFTTHVSDYDFTGDCHWLPTQGDINWGELIATLEAVDYKGPFLYECIAHEDTDFRKYRDNFDALMKR